MALRLPLSCILLCCIGICLTTFGSEYINSHVHSPEQHHDSREVLIIEHYVNIGIGRGGGGGGYGDNHRRAGSAHVQGFIEYLGHGGRGNGYPFAVHHEGQAEGGHGYGFEGFYFRVRNGGPHGSGHGRGSGDVENDFGGGYKGYNFGGAVRRGPRGYKLGSRQDGRSHGENIYREVLSGPGSSGGRFGGEVGGGQAGASYSGLGTQRGGHGSGDFEGHGIPTV